MKSNTNRAFWVRYRGLPLEVREKARAAYRLFKQDPYHASLQFKELKGKEGLYSVRIGRNHRVLGTMTDNEIMWFWIGTHAEYDTQIK